MNITKTRKIWFAFSGALVALSLILTFALGLNLGLDFLGGARWDLSLQKDGKPVVQKTVQEFFETQKGSILTKTPKIQATESSSFLVTIENISDEQLHTLKENLSQQFTVTENSFRKVDSSIGKSFQQKAFWAVIFTLIGIILTIAISFWKVPDSVSPWQFGIVAVIALFHDIIILLGVFAVLGYIFNIELDLQFITALLATLGFSVNDTIVILDRVRENLKKANAKQNKEDVIEMSVQQTLQRSINTSVSTLLPLIALLIAGANSIFFFVLALTVGIFVGTYSSIFLAAPLLLLWGKKR
ncbi:protein translocase subunit SecF [bacterium DOLZORAL124_38_8]|nr:MAG: protein translocase subunit SecF [bacterium DOLZORAL124_38_8]